MLLFSFRFDFVSPSLRVCARIFFAQNYMKFFACFVSLVLCLCLRLSQCVIFPLHFVFHFTISYGWVTSVSNSKLSCLYTFVFVRRSGAPSLYTKCVLCFTFQSKHIDYNEKRDFFLFICILLASISSSFSSSYQFTPLLFKLALFTVV